MARTPEKKVKDACTEVLREFGAYYFFPVTGGYGKSGVPDLIACYKGRFIAIECKAGYNKPTALQEKELRAIEAAAGHTLVIREDTVGELVRLLLEIKNGNR